MSDLTFTGGNFGICEHLNQRRRRNGELMIFLRRWESAIHCTKAQLQQRQHRRPIDMGLGMGQSYLQHAITTFAQ